MGPQMQALFESNFAWAEGVARSVRRGLPPSFDVEDLEQAARIELWRQVQKFDAARGVPFQAFAYPAVRGAVLMQTRRRQMKAVCKLIEMLEPLDAFLVRRVYLEGADQEALAAMWAGGPARFTKRFLVRHPDRRPSRHESAAAQDEKRRRAETQRRARN